MSSLDDARLQINDIDKEIARLFQLRMRSVEAIAEYKKASGKPIEDKARENEMILKNSAYVDEKYRRYYQSFLKNTVEISKEYQRQLNNDGNSLIVPLDKRSYEVVFAPIKNIKNYISSYDRVLVVTDSGVPQEYVRTVFESVENGYLFTFNRGEENKNTDTYLLLLNKLTELNFTRHDCVCAVGGGVCGDIAGFAASTYMRGIDFINIPTTLLSMIDSSVGGKTAIDFRGYKNLIGSFYQPKCVLIDVASLKTLPKEQYNCGLVEALKMFATHDRSMFELCESQDKPDITSVIREALKIKISVVSCDERESGLRKVLNFGHTVGHAVETVSYLHGKPLYHGQCVGIGMLCITHGHIRERIKKLLISYGLPTSFSCGMDELADAMLHDKKSEDGKISVVTLPDIGEFRFVTMSIDEIIDNCREVLNLS